MNVPATPKALYALLKRSANGRRIRDIVLGDYSPHARGRCWLFVGGRRQSPSRKIWELVYGPLDTSQKAADGRAAIMVCHHCDRPRCGRPTHFFLGTSLDNQIDARKKGRRVWTWSEEDKAQLRGENNVSKRPEVRAKISLKKRGYKYTGEALEHIQQSARYTRTSEHRRRVSEQAKHQPRIGQRFVSANVIAIDRHGQVSA